MIAEHKQEHARAKINGMPGAHAAETEELNHKHAGIAEHNQEHASQMGIGVFMVYALVREYAPLEAQILWDAQPVKQEHARTIAVGARAQVQAPALPARLNV